jgi:hypothetical protein
MLLGDILFSLTTAFINTLLTTPIFSLINNFFGIPFRLAGV